MLYRILTVKNQHPSCASIYDSYAVTAEIPEPPPPKPSATSSNATTPAVAAAPLLPTPQPAEKPVITVASRFSTEQYSDDYFISDVLQTLSQLAYGRVESYHRILVSSQIST